MASPIIFTSWGKQGVTDRARRCLDRYFFYRDTFTDTVSRQQVRWSQVFQREDPGEEDLVYMQGADSHGQSSAVSA